jgi:DNA-binding transcriptional LysR family regulator
MSSDPPVWDHVQTFLAVLREGSLSGAARALGLTQPTAARHVDELEAALGGVSLFTRSPQGLTPTPAALRLAPHAETMASAARALERAATGGRDEVSGVVRVSASHVVGAEVLPGILSAIRDEHPGLAFEIVLSNATSDLLRRDADIAVRMTRPKQQALIAKRVGEVKIGLHAHPDYLARRGVPETPDDVAEHTLIGFDTETVSVRALRAIGLTWTRDQFALRTDAELAQLAAIRAGCGIGGCQVGLAKRAPILTRVLEDHFSFALETWITMHEDLRNDRRMRAVFDHLVEAVGAYAATS